MSERRDRLVHTDMLDHPEDCWHPALQTDHGGGSDGQDLREGAWVPEATDLIGLSGWPEGSRLILRKERRQPGALRQR